MMSTTTRRFPKLLGLFVLAVIATAAVQGKKFPGGTYTAYDGTNNIALDFDSAGGLLVYVNNEAFSQGGWEVKADTIDFGPLQAPEGYGCAGSGRYLWSIAEKALTVKVVSDDCQIRVQYFTGLTWTKQ